MIFRTVVASEPRIRFFVTIVYRDYRGNGDDAKKKSNSLTTIKTIKVTTDLASISREVSMFGQIRRIEFEKLDRRAEM